MKLTTIGAASTASELLDTIGYTAPGEELASLEEAISANARMVAKSGASVPWVGYLCSEGSTPVGCCAFTSPPKGRVVEIAYYTFAPHEGRGVAKRMAFELLAIARASDQVTTVSAFTLPHENASTSVLKSHGFVRAGEAVDEDAGVVWAWALPLEDSATAP